MIHIPQNVYQLVQNILAGEWNQKMYMWNLCSFASWNVLQVDASALLLSAKGLPTDHSGSYIVLWKQEQIQD